MLKVVIRGRATTLLNREQRSTIERYATLTAPVDFARGTLTLMNRLRDTTILDWREVRHAHISYGLICARHSCSRKTL
jgi:hypothetical protein